MTDDVEVTCVDIADDELAAVSGSGVLQQRHDVMKAIPQNIRA
jgi:hypothetical protein